MSPSKSTAVDYRHRATNKRQQRQNNVTISKSANEETRQKPQSMEYQQPTCFQARPRSYRLTVALPGSVLTQAQSAELQTYLVGQLARSCAIFQVDEVVIYREQPILNATQLLSEPLISNTCAEKEQDAQEEHDDENDDAMEISMDTLPIQSGDDGLFVSFTDTAEAISQANQDIRQKVYSAHQLTTVNEKESMKELDLDMLARRIFEYMECPPYLRRALFPHHRDLRYAGLLNPLELPHHLRRNEWFPFREGVVVAPPQKQKQSAEPGHSHFVDCGWPEPVKITQKLPINTRVTLAMSRTTKAEGGQRSHISGECVSPDLPRQQGWYWGYRVRLAESFREIFTNCPYESGYHITVGTSDNGHSIWDNVPSVDQWLQETDTTLQHSPENPVNVLIVFGGAHGIEVAVENDPSIGNSSVSARDCFDFWVNTCPFQGSRMIRTEESMLMSMGWLIRWLENSKEITTTTSEEQGSGK